MATPFQPGYVAPPNLYGNFLSTNASGWPDGGYDADGDGLSDNFESANSWEETVVQTTSWTDEFGEEHHQTESATVIRGLRWNAADSDGDGLPDGYELLTLAPLMDAAGRPRYDPTVAEGDRDDDGDGIPTIEEIAIWWTNPLAEDTDGDGFGDLDEIAVRLFQSPRPLRPRSRTRRGWERSE